MVKIGKKKKNDDLYRAILLLKDEKECYDFFQDLCTVSELRAMRFFPKGKGLLLLSGYMLKRCFHLSVDCPLLKCGPLPA